MSQRRDVVIIGGGHNGLITAFYLAKTGYKPLVLERGAQVGGAAVTDEFHPGFRCLTLAHTAGPIQPQIVRDMQLEKHGLRWITPEVCVTALSPDGRALSLYQDTNKSAQEIAAFSQKDAAKYSEFQQSLGKIAKVIGEALATTPPDIDHPSRGDLCSMAGLSSHRARRRRSGIGVRLARPLMLSHHQKRASSLVSPAGSSSVMRSEEHTSELQSLR